MNYMGFKVSELLTLFVKIRQIPIGLDINTDTHFLFTG
jgi:hypothetical protein